MAFDIQKALEEGYSKADVLQYLAKTRQFDLAGALSEGYSEDDVLQYFSSTAPKKTLGGYTREALKAVPRGFVSGLESAALGAAALLPGDTEEGFEKTAREGIKGFAERLKPEAAVGYEEAIPTKLGEAIGSMGTLLIPGGVGGLAARGLGLAARTGQLAAVAPTAAAMGAGEARERAVQEKATPEQIERATQLGIIPGLAELAPVERIFRVLPKELTGTILNRIQRAFTTGGFEGAQETASGIAQNLIAQQVYKPSQELIEGVGEQAAYGFGAGAIVQGLLDAAIGKRARPTPKPAAEKPAEGYVPPAVIEQPVPPAPRTEAETALSNLLAAREQYEALPIDDERRIAWAGNVAKQQEILDKIDAVKAEKSAFAEQSPDLFGEYRPLTQIEERPDFELAPEIAAEQLQLPLEQPVQPQETAIYKEQPSSIVTAQTLADIGVNAGAIKTAKFSKEVQGLDLSKPEDIDTFEKAVKKYGEKSSAKKPYSTSALKRLVSNARFRLAQQTSFDFQPQQTSFDFQPQQTAPDVRPQQTSFDFQPQQGAPDVRPETRTGREGMVAPVQPETAKGQGAVGARPADVAGAEGPVDTDIGGKRGEQRALSDIDIEDIETAKATAAPANKAEFKSAITYLSYFANSTNPEITPDISIAARKALADLNVPAAEVQAAWENIAIGEAAAQQEQSEDAALEASKRTQRNIADQLRREGDTTPRKSRAKTDEQLQQEQAQKTAFEQSEENKRLQEWQNLEMPPELDWVNTPEDVRKLMQSYFDEYNTQQENTKRQVEESGTKRRLSAAERKKLRADEQLGALGLPQTSNKESRRTTPPKFTAIRLGVNDVAPETMAQIDSLMEQAQRADDPAVRKSLRNTAYREIFNAIRETKDRVVIEKSRSEFNRLVRKLGYSLSHTPVGAKLSKDAVELLQKGDLKGALKLLGESGSTPIIRTAARKILSAIKGTKVLIRKTPTGDAGIYSPTTDTIYIDPEGLHEHTLLHEAMHAAVSHVLANPNHQLTKKLQALFDSIPAEIKGKLDLQEFAAEAISNQEFQNKLRGQPKNWWGRFVDAIRGFLGLSKSQQVQKTLDKLLEAAPSEARRGDIGALRLTTATGIGPDLQGYLDRNAQQIKEITERNKQGSWIKALRNAIVEKGASLTEKLREKGEESGIRAAQVYGLSLRSMDLAINSMLNGAIELDPDTRNQWFKVNTNTPSFKDIQAEIDKIAEVVGDRKTAQRIFGLGATILRLRSPEISPEIRKSMNVSAEDMKAGDEALARFGTEIRTALAKWTQFKNALLKVGEKTGRFTKEDVEQWMKAPEYVPWHRVLDDAKFGYETKKSTKQYFSRLVDNGKIAELIGGDVNKRPIGDIFDNMINLSTWLINTTVKNHTANQLADALVDIGSAEQLKTKEQSKTGNVTKTYRNGEETFWDLDDPYDMDAFGPVSTIALPVLSIFGKKVTIPGVTNLLRKGTTYMPGFVVSQLFQDAYRATILSGLNNPFKVGANTFTNFGKAIGPAREENLTYKALMEAGIVARADFAVGEERGRLDAALDRSQKGINKAVKSAATFMENMARASDAAQRMSLFENTMEETGDKLDALSRASEIINFQRQGTNAVFNTLRQTVPFMNAYIQGMDVIYRSLFKEGISAKSRSEALRRLYATAAKVFALSMVYAMLVSDDDEYKNTPDHEKLTSFIIPGSRKIVKDVTGVDIGGNLRIPTPTDPLGFLFKSIPEQTYNYIASQGTATPIDNTKFLRIMRDGAVNAVSSPNTIPQFAKPTIEIMTNYSFFTGNPIVGKYLQGMPKEAQFTENTSELAKILSPFTPMSPVQLDYFIRGTLGTAGGASMYFLSQAINAASPSPLPDSKLNQNPLVRPFITGREGGGLKEDYYELREAAQQVANVVSKYKDADPQEALRYVQENPKLYALAKSGLFTQMDAVIKQLRDARQIIRASKTMTPEEKRERIDQLDAAEIQVFQRINLAVMRNIGGL